MKVRGKERQRGLPFYYVKNKNGGGGREEDLMCPQLHTAPRWQAEAVHTEVEQMRNVVFLLFPGRKSEPIKHPES